MKLALSLLGMSALLALSPVTASEMVGINMCYQKAGEKELKYIQAEHKDAVERVTVIAKSWDKPNHNRVRWDKQMKANQAFESYVKRECDFIKNTTKGRRTQEVNAQLACRINLYRMRTDMLENRFLSSARE